MDRAEAIKFKLMPDGHIRGHDTRKGTGASECHITNPHSVCDTVTTSHAHKILINNKIKRDIYVEYHEKPTKEDLLEYFGQRIKIRKMTPREAFRLMDVDDADIDRILNATVSVPQKDGTAKDVKAISKTACYKLAGNSIVVSCLYHIFRILLVPDQPENAESGKQLALF